MKEFQHDTDLNDTRDHDNVRHVRQHVRRYHENDGKKGFQQKKPVPNGVKNEQRRNEAKDKKLAGKRSSRRSKRK